MALNTQLFSELLLFISLGAIYLGLAGLLGSLLFRARQRLGWQMQTLIFCLAILIYLGISLLAPWDSRLMHAQFIILVAIVLVFSLRPIRRPAWLWRTAHGFHYLSFTLTLVVIWSLIGETNPAKLILTPWAGLAAVLAWLRSRELSAETTLQQNAAPLAAQELNSQTQPSADGIQGERGSV